MSDTTMLKHYQNLLVLLAKHYVRLISESKRLKLMAGKEPSPGKKSGLFCQSRVKRKDATALKDLLSLDRTAMMRLFGTSNLMTIAKQSLLL